MNHALSLPDVIDSEEALDEFITRPSAELVAFVRTLQGPLLLLGAGGKMGPTLAVRARRAAESAGVPLPIIAVSRFSDANARRWLEERGIETIAADLFDRSALARLPEAQNIIYLVGLKFGTSQNPSSTWAVNTIVPAEVMQRYSWSRIVALSTGNVYPLVPVDGGGAIETDALMPLGEYANAAVARERIFEFYSRQNNTPVVLIRLNYAIGLRYGVLLDIAQRVNKGETIDLTTGYLNCIWQGDANDLVIRALPLASAPPTALNLTGTERLSVRQLAEEFGRLLDKPVRFSGTEAETALLSNTGELARRLGTPATPVADMVRWTADWLRRGGSVLGKPTGFAVRDGRF
jgi:nucleoside-diphosphate-sugar epimerase